MHKVTILQDHSKGDTLVSPYYVGIAISQFLISYSETRQINRGEKWILSHGFYAIEAKLRPCYYLLIMRTSNYMPQVLKDFLRRRGTGNEPAYHNQIEKYVDPDEFYDVVAMDSDREWTWYNVDGDYCSGDSRKASCIHFQSKTFDANWGEEENTCSRYCPHCRKRLD